MESKNKNKKGQTEDINLMRALRAIISAWESFTTSPRGLRSDPPRHLVPVPRETTCSSEKEKEVRRTRIRVLRRRLGFYKREIRRWVVGSGDLGKERK